LAPNITPDRTNIVYISAFCNSRSTCSLPAEDFPRRAGPGELCFFEDLDPALWLAEAEEVVLYHWNRTYPSDRRFPLPLAGWTLARREEFPGSSH